jgi:hypothetical protein
MERKSFFKLLFGGIAGLLVAPKVTAKAPIEFDEAAFNAQVDSVMCKIEEVILERKECEDALRSPVPEFERKAMKLPRNATWADAIAISNFRAAARELREPVEGRPTQRFELPKKDGVAEFSVLYSNRS